MDKSVDIIGQIVIESHGTRRPHQIQDLIIRDHIPDISGCLAQVKNMKKVTDAERSRLAKIASERLEGKIDTNRIKKILSEVLKEEDIDAPFQISKRWCDVHECKIDDDKVVVRALSQVFNVDTRKIKMSSRIVLAEVILNDYASEEEAIEAVVEKASNPTRPLTIETLRHLKRPLEHGYSEEEIYIAIYPYIVKWAKMYSNNKFPVDDGIQQGYLGMHHSLNADRAISPYSSHAYRYMQTNIHRYAATKSGLIAHGERDRNFHGSLGVHLGFDEDGNPIYNRIQSADIVINNDDVNMYDFAVQESYLLNRVDYDPGPYDVAIDKESKRNAKKKMEILFDNAGFTVRQAMVVCLSNALVDYMDNPYEPGLNPHNPTKSQVDADKHKKWEDNREENSIRWSSGHWLHTDTEIALAMGTSRQRIGQHTAKYKEKLYRAAKEMTEYEIKNKAKTKKINKKLVVAALDKINLEKPIWNGKEFIKR